MSLQHKKLMKFWFIAIAKGNNHVLIIYIKSLSQLTAKYLKTSFDHTYQIILKVYFSLNAGGYLELHWLK